MKESTADPAFTSIITRRGFFSLLTISLSECAPTTLVPVDLQKKKNTHTKKTKGLIRRTAEGRSLLTFRFVSKKLVHFLCGSVIHANHEAVVVHVEDEVLAL